MLGKLIFETDLNEDFKYIIFNETKKNLNIYTDSKILEINIQTLEHKIVIF